MSELETYSRELESDGIAERRMPRHVLATRRVELSEFHSPNILRILLHPPPPRFPSPPLHELFPNSPSYFYQAASQYAKVTLKTIRLSV